MDVHVYQQCFNEGDIQYKMLDAVVNSVMNHMQYLTKELIIFALFDENLSDGERKALVNKLLASHPPRNFFPGVHCFYCNRLFIPTICEYGLIFKITFIRF